MKDDRTRDTIRNIARGSILLHSAMILGCMKLKKDFIESIICDDKTDPKEDQPKEKSDTKTEKTED